MSTAPPPGIAINRHVMEMEYAVRGAIPQRAAELAKQGMTIIPCNIGNPQALGQKPVSFCRQVLSLIEYPARIGRERKLNQIAATSAEAFGDFTETDFISDYALDLSEKCLSRMTGGIGAYSESKGPLFIREAIAAFIDRRDGVDSTPGVSANPDHIFITNGASEAARNIIELLIADKNDGIMIPIPQYPLYSATIHRAGGAQVNYYPDEDSGWVFHKAILEESLASAKKDGVRVKAIVIINPGNPTGVILDKATITEVIDFAEEHGIVIIADEVYQENVYGEEFVSFARVLGERAVPLFSLHSVSKGFYGECGHRGGYVEVRNPPHALGTDMSVVDIMLKQTAVRLCSNTAGQILVYLMTSPPAAGSEPHRQFTAEKEYILNQLYEKATMIREGFKEMDAIECFGKTGAMYLFPRLNKLPTGTTDFDYCMSLLEKTGLCTVNGAGFGQEAGTQHLRIAFLPPKRLLQDVLAKWITFHNDYLNKT